jgi:hypothetical protein
MHHGRGNFEALMEVRQQSVRTIEAMYKLITHDELCSQRAPVKALAHTDVFLSHLPI